MFSTRWARGGAEVGVVLRIDAECFPPGRRLTRGRLYALLRPPRECVLTVAEDGFGTGKVVGYAIYRRASDGLRLLRVAVGEAHRRRGAGADLVRGVVRRADTLDTWCRPRDEYLAFHLLLQRAGFVSVGVRGERYLFLKEGRDG